MAEKPERHGRAKVLTIDFDALPLLLEMAPSQKSQGRFISELIRAEKSRREERERVKAELLQVLA